MSMSKTFSAKKQSNDGLTFSGLKQKKPVKREITQAQTPKSMTKFTLNKNKVQPVFDASLS